MSATDDERATIAEALGFLGDDRALIDEVLTTALATIADGAARMERAAATNDGEALALAAHRLKGAAASIGGARLAARAAQIERDARRDRPASRSLPDDFRIAVATLDANLRAVRAAPARRS